MIICSLNIQGLNIKSVNNVSLYCLGSIKVWDFGSGQLHKLHQHSPKESDIKDSTITDLVYFSWAEKQCLFVSSWGHTVRIFEVKVFLKTCMILLYGFE